MPFFVTKTIKHAFLSAGSSRTNWSALICTGIEKKKTININCYLKGLAVGTAALLLQQNSASLCESEVKEYTVDEVSKHNSPSTGIWVCYQGNVYDITEFVKNHPGGMQKIMLAAGKSIEPFWALYGVHKKSEVRELLEQFQIGVLKDAPKVDLDALDPYKNDPPRHPAFLINSEKPFNAEPPPELLMDSFITPNELFYKRNHLPVPVIDPETYRLEIVIPGKEAVSLTLVDLKTKFKHYSVVAAIQCAGNRRVDMAAVKPLRGLSWGGTAIGNAEWTGVKLKDVLAYCGLDAEKEEEFPHIHFDGLDTDMEKCYAVSIPTDKAMDPRGDTLLAFAMNGEELPRDHGYPIRVVVPGVAGARMVKWLGRISSAKEESQGHWQQKDYKGFSPSIDWDSPPDFENAPSIQELPVQSMITVPKSGDTFEPGDEVVIKGYSWSGGGRGIVRVDVSIDGGQTWHVANLHPTGQDVRKTWAWTPFTFTFTIPENASSEKIQLICKAVDSSFNVQPDSFAPIWNLRGVLSNAWHRVNLQIVQDKDEAL